ncbi:SDR family NAD(P)-dependent oxidoreductase [Runella sp. MFBS21]|uniref:SDR family NAD(P)-dependent oxidoreductase n=1 Tax=Runella sp. MFBS21 TaxID=3034018 RepID=UPI0023F64455|nr:SDR family NAD(P)-dependent oxidoreductase [Runella sp. MFBS21]MDF7819959.1 SDR family NAD(P)-dependent oxidoreductase [Runella sp. MFBS21]
MTSVQQTIVITGCDSGIGRALALEFYGRGHRVYATGLQPAALTDLQHRGLVTQMLDVTDQQNVDALCARLRADGTPVDILINNAGYGAMGPTIEMPLEEVRRQFEVNVLGLLRVSQALAVDMMTRRRGMIINIGSTAGVLTSPFAGVYCATKSAVHALTDALRLELGPLGIQVVRVEPNMIRSGFGQTAAEGLQARFRPESVYWPVRGAALARALGSQTADAMPAEELAYKLANSVLSPNPPIRIRIGRQLLIYTLLKPFLPARWIDRLLQKRFKLHELNPLLL